MKDFAEAWNGYWRELPDELVAAVRSAACPWVYDVDPVGRAVALARMTMRELRRLGLYPSNAELEAETRRAA
jgi:hypothetical protein